jgi:hypothetical protein
MMLRFLQYQSLFFVVLAFTPARYSSVFSRQSVELFGLSEWRDLPLQAPQHPDGVVRCIPVLLADSSDVALQGETKYFQFHEVDEVRLFQQAIDHNEGIFGLGFVSEDDVFYDKISLVEIRDYNMMGDDFGIFCSAQVVGLGVVLPAEFAEDNGKRSVTTLCSEIHNRVERITLKEANEMAELVESLIADICTVESSDCVDDGDAAEGRWERYQTAYQQALLCDGQGYNCYPDASSQSMKKSWSEVNAVSWAAFSTGLCLRNDETYRLAALDNDCLTNRLKLATYWLSDVLLEAHQVI